MFVAVDPNRENMRKLADALDSGKYAQGDAALRTKNDKFCCLGVACDISGLGQWVLSGTSSLNYKYEVVGDNDFSAQGTALLTPAMCRWLGTSNEGRFTYPGSEDVQTLTNINDSGKFTFSQIADILRCEAITWYVYEADSA